MNKPVAWMKKQYSHDIGEWVDYREDTLDGYIPLYTHPAELTDEEIDSIFLDGEFYEHDKEGNFRARAFAKAILRKAQEK